MTQPDPPTRPDPLTSRWFLVLNDVTGGWSVGTKNAPLSTYEYHDVLVADAYNVRVAAALVRQHNRELAVNELAVQPTSRDVQTLTSQHSASPDETLEFDVSSGPSAYVCGHVEYVIRLVRRHPDGSYRQLPGSCSVFLGSADAAEHVARTLTTLLRRYRADAAHGDGDGDGDQKQH